MIKGQPESHETQLPKSRVPAKMPSADTEMTERTDGEHDQPVEKRKASQEPDAIPAPKRPKPAHEGSTEPACPLPAPAAAGRVPFPEKVHTCTS